MKKLDVKKIAKAIKNKIISVIIIIAIFLTVGVFYSYQLTKPIYQVNTKVAIFKEKENILPEDKTVSNYQEVLRSNTVLEKLKVQIKAEDTAITELANKIFLKKVENTDFFEIAIQSENKEEAKKIAQTILPIWQEKLTEIYEIQEIKTISMEMEKEEPINIHHTRDILLFGIIGTFVSFIYAFIRTLLDTSIKSEKDIEELVKLRCIGKLPKYNLKRSKGSKTILKDFNTLRANIQFLSMNKKIKTILVTSVGNKEGKSFVVSKLAEAFAKTGKKVVLVDCNLSKPVQAEYYGLEQSPGLTNYLSGINEDGSANNWKIKSYLRKTKIDNLFFIPAGTVVPNPVELLVSDKMIELAEQIKSFGDIILLDGSDMTTQKEILLLSNMLDATILIAGYKEEKIYKLNRAKNTLRENGGKILGVILNKVPSSQTIERKKKTKKEKEPKTITITVREKTNEEIAKEEKIKAKGGEKSKESKVIHLFAQKSKEVKEKEEKKAEKIKTEKKEEEPQKKRTTKKETSQKQTTKQETKPKTTKAKKTTAKKEQQTKKTQTNSAPRKRRKKKPDLRTQEILEQMDKFFYQDNKEK